MEVMKKMFPVTAVQKHPKKCVLNPVTVVCSSTTQPPNISAAHLNCNGQIQPSNKMKGAALLATNTQCQLATCKSLWRGEKRKKKLENMKVLFGFGSRWDKIPFNCLFHECSFNPIVTAVVFHPTDNTQHTRRHTLAYTQYTHRVFTEKDFFSAATAKKKNCLASHKAVFFFKQIWSRNKLAFKIKTDRECTEGTR